MHTAKADDQCIPPRPERQEKNRMRPVSVAALIRLASSLAAAQDSKRIPIGSVKTGEKYLCNCP
jgi:hypothetical protein